MDRERIIASVGESECFRAESASLARGGFHVADRPGLFKELENGKVRLIYPTKVEAIEEGASVGLVCLFDMETSSNVYAHAIFAGSSSNASLRSLFVPSTQAKPQPGIEGAKAILKFVAWKQAAWTKFLNDELELGTAKASSIWLANFWTALDRMYGGGNLLRDALPVGRS